MQDALVTVQILNTVLFVRGGHKKQGKKNNLVILYCCRRIILLPLQNEKKKTPETFCVCSLPKIKSSDRFEVGLIINSHSY